MSGNAPNITLLNSEPKMNIPVKNEGLINKVWI